MFSGTRWKPDPARRENAQHVAVGKQRDSALDFADPGNHPVHPRTHLVRRLAVSSIAEDQPGTALVDLLKRHTLVLAVIPLDQVEMINGLVVKTRQFRRSCFSIALGWREQA